MTLRRTHAQSTEDAIRAERGFVLVSVLMGATLLVALGSSGLILSRTDLQITSNFLTGTQTLYIAEAGINHAWSILDDADTFDDTFAAGDTELLTEIPFGVGEYTVTTTALAGSDPSTLVITSEADGPGNARRQLEAMVQRVNDKTNMVSWKESFQ